MKEYAELYAFFIYTVQDDKYVGAVWGTDIVDAEKKASALFDMKSEDIYAFRSDHAEETLKTVQRRREKLNVR